MGRSAMPPEPSRPSGPKRSARVRLPATIDRDDVPAVVERCLEAVRAGEPLTADCRDLVEPALPAVEVLAQLALESARRGGPFGLTRATPRLLDLVRLCGLDPWLREDPR